jgi:type II secretory pathway component GspD/PulD (secretin)
MVSNQYRRYTGYRIFSILAALLLLLPCTGAWPQGKGLQAEDTRLRRAAKGLQVVVQEGRLSVDFQEADLGEVLAQIGRQAGIRISSGPSSGKRVSARFAGVELEDGLRRLLRAVSLSHSFLYAKGPAGTVTIAELRVLGEGKDTSPGPATVAEPRLQENEQNTGTPVRKARRQAPGVVEPIQEPTSDADQGEPSEVTRRFREVFKLSKEMKGKPADGQESSPHEAK